MWLPVTFRLEELLVCACAGWDIPLQLLLLLPKPLPPPPPPLLLLQQLLLQLQLLAGIRSCICSLLAELMAHEIIPSAAFDRCKQSTQACRLSSSSPHPAALSADSLAKNQTGHQQV